jgi:hypothetical protein
MVEVTAINIFKGLEPSNLTIKSDGQETVLADQVNSNEFTESKTVVPGMAEITVFGKFFRMDLSDKKGKSLLIMITPRIIKSDELHRTSKADSSDFTVIAIDALGNVIESENITSINEQTTADVPTKYQLAQNYPNPFNPTTEINYQLPQNAHVNLVIYDQLGQLVRRLVNREQPAGSYNIQWDGLNQSGNAVASGIYLYHVEATYANSITFVDTKKMVLLR